MSETNHVPQTTAAGSSIRRQREPKKKKKNQIPIGILVVLIIAVLMFILAMVKFNQANAYLLVLHYDEYSEQAINAELRRSVKSFKLRSKTLTRAGAEMTYEVRLSERHEVVTRMLDIEGVHDATLVACQSEVGA